MASTECTSTGLFGDHAVKLGLAIAAGVGATVTWMWLTCGSNSHECARLKTPQHGDVYADVDGCRRVHVAGGDDESLMRHAIQVAKRAVDNGNHPFGAILVDKSTGVIIAEAENTAMTSSDCTRHAELNLVSFGCRQSIALDNVVLVTSTEPCAMCATAMYWAGIREVVYGTPESSLNKIVLSIDADGPALPIPCRELWAKGKTWLGEFNVVGPVLEQEANEVHENFWPEFLAQFTSVHG